MMLLGALGRMASEKVVRSGAMLAIRLSLVVLMVVAAVVQANREGMVRLVGGRTSHQGNVEIFHVGRWGSVCDDEWDKPDADVVCRMLGYKNASQATHNSFFGRGRRIIWMDNLYCHGHESNLSSCPFDGWGINDCTSAEAAGVKCETSEVATTPASAVQKDEPRAKLRAVTKKDMKVRLAGGRSANEGRVEIYIPKKGWSLVCGDGWGMLEAMTVCRQLGRGYAQAPVQSSFFGGSHKNISFSGVQCTGKERNIADCLHDRMGQVFCPGRDENIAGVMCTRDLPDLVIDEQEIETSSYLEDRQMLFLQCAMEENCLSTSAYELNRNEYGWLYERRRLLRFTARIGNVGTAEFRPFLPKHAWQWHMCHLHYHSMEVFAHFDIIDGNGTKVAEGHKASFCLEDTHCTTGIDKKFACANYGDQGISVGCTDTYLHNIDCQWIDITDLAAGSYLLKVSINPEYKLAEVSYDNNAATCHLFYNAVSAHVWNCTLGRP